jgi:hypothetical protein
MRIARCDDCKAEYNFDGAMIIPLCDVPHLFERLTPGEETPAGACNKCGALCFLVKDQDFGEYIASLFNQGLSNKNIAGIILEEDSGAEDLVARIRVMMETWVPDPFPQGHLTTYLEVARAALADDLFSSGLAHILDMRNEEIAILKRDVEHHLGEGHA